MKKSYKRIRWVIYQAFPPYKAVLPPLETEEKARRIQSDWNNRFPKYLVKIKKIYV